MSPASRVLVAGGAGFVGSHLCDRLIREGHEVLCVDNLLTGRASNVGHLRGHPRFRFLEADIGEAPDLAGPLDWLLNFASPASPKDYARYPIATLKASAVGTYRTLEIARAAGASYLLASTSEVYGDPQVNPQPESYWGNVNPVGPRSPYDEAKRYAEAMSAAYARVYDMDVRIIRIFNTYGPRMRLEDGRALPEFMRRALRGEPLSLYGDGSQTRSFCYVDDLVEGVDRLMRAPRDTLREAGVPPVLNLGNPEEVTILQLAREIISLAQSESSIARQPLPQDDPRVRRPDISLARRLLCWEPRVPREQGLRLALEYFRQAARPVAAEGAHRPS